MQQEGQRTNLPHTHHDKAGGAEDHTRPCAPRPNVHTQKRAPRYTDLGRNTIKMGEHTSLMVVAASKRFDMVSLQERAVSEMIYLTNIKLAHYNGPEFLLNQTLRQHLLCQRCFLFQFICRTAMLAVHYLLVLLTPAKAPFKLLTRPWLSEPSLQTLN